MKRSGKGPRQFGGNSVQVICPEGSYLDGSYPVTLTRLSVQIIVSLLLTKLYAF